MPFDFEGAVEKCGLPMPKIEPVAPIPPVFLKLFKQIEQQDKHVEKEVKKFFSHDSGPQKDLIKKALGRYLQFKKGKNVRWDDLIQDFLKRKLAKNQQDLLKKMLPVYKKRWFNDVEWQMVQTILLKKKLQDALKKYEKGQTKK